MTRHATLAARIARLERAKRPRSLPRMVFTLYDQEDAVAGFSGPSGEVVEREPFEAVTALSARAWAIIGGHSMWATYPDAVWDEPEEVPPNIVAMGWTEPEPIKPEPVDPFALAGIGRRATPEELARMGVAPRYQ